MDGKNWPTPRKRQRDRGDFGSSPETQVAHAKRERVCICILCAPFLAAVEGLEMNNQSVNGAETTVKSLRRPSAKGLA
jgi:hypothetical protein